MDTTIHITEQSKWTLLMLHINNTYINADKEPKFKVGDHVRISKYKNIFAKGYTAN